MDLKNQRLVASKVLKCGVNRVYIHPDRMEDVADAVTRSDVKLLIKSGAIVKKQKKGISRARTQANKEQKRRSKRRGQGSRKGTRNARDPKKRRWIRTIRPIRTKLRELKGSGQIDVPTYRSFYRQASGGVFKNTSHLMLQLQAGGHLKEVK